MVALELDMHCDAKRLVQPMVLLSTSTDFISMINLLIAVRSLQVDYPRSQ